MTGEASASGDPIRVRFFVDDVSGIAFWPDALGGPGDERDSFDEAELPLSDGLRQRVQRWVDEYTEAVATGDRSFDLVAHDLRGHRLSLDLQAELGAGYVVQYSFNTSEGRQAAADT